ncbi:MAG: c-type cytochrome [Pseudomonadota bacterium]
MRAKKLLMIAMLGMVATGASATDDQADVKAAQSKPAIRGGIVFKTYCALCHGIRADGASKATKLYGNAALDIKPRSPEYYDKIIRKGGPAVGKSPYMPPWEDELSNEQISDVVAYLGITGDSAHRGEVVFKTNCVLCHGVKGDGKGRASVLFNPPPANLTMSDKNDDYKRMIITMGGAAMGRSPVMPVWGEQLSAQEIEDVVAYLRTILVKQP